MPFASGGRSRLASGFLGFAAVVLANWTLFALAQTPEPAPIPVPTPLPTPESMPTAESSADLPSLDELLAMDTGLDYDESKRCLGLHRFYEVRALDENHIVFEMRGGDYYLVQLERRCPGLRPQNAVMYEHRSTRLCALDRVRGVGVAGGFSPSCQLGRFQPVSAEQIALLEEALKQRMADRKHRGRTLKDAESNPESQP